MQRSVRYLIHRLEESRLARLRCHSVSIHRESTINGDRGALQKTVSLSIATAPKKQALWQKLIAVVVAVTLWTGPLQMVWQDAANSASQIAGGRQQKLVQQEAIDWHFFAAQLKDALHADQQKPDWSTVYALLENRLPGLLTLLWQKAGAQMPTFQFGTTAYAAPIADPAAPIRFQPQVTQSTGLGGGVPVVNITAPNAAGISLNQYSQFNVDAIGLILNNSLVGGGSALGGNVAANAALGGHTATQIINQVTTQGSPSAINGSIEVFGAPAQVIIANPNGISCTACGFINTPRVTMTTGTPQFLTAPGGVASDFDHSGAAAYDVQGGHIQIEALAGSGGTVGTGIEGSTAAIDLIGGSIGVNAAINGGQQINLISGQQVVSQALPGQGKDGSDYNVSANGSAPNFSGPDPTVQIDASAFGAMNAGQIKIIGTTNGLGVRTLGNVNATAGSLTIDANGDVTTANAYGSQGVTVRADGTAAIGQLTSYGGASVTAGSDLAVGQLTVANDAQLTGNNVAVGETVIGGNLTANAGGIMVTDQNGAIAGNAQLTAGTALINSGNWTVGNNLTVTAGGIQNNTSSSLIGLANTTLTASDVINNGTLYGNNLVLRIANTLNNNFGALQAKTLLDVRANALTGNVGGVMYAGDPSAVAGSTPTGDLSLVISGADGSFNNAAGLIEAGNNLTLNAANQSFDPGAVVSGQINLNGALSLSVGSFTNSSAWSLPGATVSISSANGITNTGVMQTLGDFNLASANGVIANSGAIVAGQDLNAAGAISNAAGAIMHAERDVNINGSGTNAGTVEALRDINLQGGSFDNTNGVVQANRNISTNLTGTLTNIAGTIAGGQDVTLNAGSIINDRAAPVTLVSTTSQVNDLDLVLSTYIGDFMIDPYIKDGQAAQEVKAYISTLVLNTGTWRGGSLITDGVLSGEVTTSCDECGPPIFFSAALPTVDSIQMQQTEGKAGQILAGNNVFITANNLSNRGSVISAGNNLVAGLSNLDNGASDTVVTNRIGETVNQASLHAFFASLGDAGFALIAYSANGGFQPGPLEGPFSPGTTITPPSTVVETTIAGKLGTLQAGNNATLNGTGNLTNAGNLIAGNNIAITLPGNFVNQGAYDSQFTSTPGCLPGGKCSDPNAHVDTFAYQQTPNTVIAGGSLTVTAGTIANDYGSLAARGDVSLSANTLDNLAGTIQSTGGNVNIAAATIINHVVSPVVTQTSFGSANPDFAPGCNAGGMYKGSECTAEMDNAASNAAIINGAQNVTINGDSLTNAGGLITAGVDADINISGAITNTDVALNTDWQGHWIEETCWTCDDVNHYTSGVVADGNQAAAIQAGTGLTLTSGGNLLNTGNLYGSNVDLSGNSLINGIMDSSTPTASSTVAPQLVSLGPVGTASGGSGAPSTQAPLYAVSVPGSDLLSDLGPNLLVDNLPPALRPDNALFYYDGTAEDQQIQQAALTQTGTGTFINGVTWDSTNQLSIDDQQKAILYNNTIDFATQNNIQLGQPLTPQQISSIDKPMLWYTEQSVPDPSCSFTATLCPNINALMPQVVLPQNYTGTTAGGTISGNNVNLTFADSITNTGIIQATDLNVTTNSLTNEQRSVDIGKQAYQVQGGWMEYSGTQLQPGGFMSAVNLDVQAQNITAVNNAFQVLNADGTPDAAGTAALLSSLKQQLGSNFTQTSVQDDIQHNFIQDTSGPGALGAVIAIVIAIVLAVVTAGAGLAIVAAATGSAVAAGSAAAIVAAGLQAAIVGTLSSLATQLVTTGSLDIGAALKSGAVSGIIGGATAGVLNNAPGSSAASGSTAASADSGGSLLPQSTGLPPVSQANWASLISNPQYIENSLIRAGISAGVNSVAYGGSFGTALANNLIGDAAAAGANAIGDWTIPSDGSAPNELENILGHAVLGCAASAAAGTGCAGGAIGGATSAAISSDVIKAIDPTGAALTPDQKALVAALATLAGGAAAGLAGADAQAGANSAANEVLNNATADNHVAAEAKYGGFWGSLANIYVNAEQYLAGKAIDLSNQISITQQQPNGQIPPELQGDFGGPPPSTGGAVVTAAPLQMLLCSLEGAACVMAPVIVPGSQGSVPGNVIFSTGDGNNGENSATGSDIAGANNPSSSNSGIGNWVPVNESMSERAQTYQTQITGSAGHAYVVNDVKFDGIASDGTLLEAKGPGYANFVASDGNFQPWFDGQASLLDQAERQLQAAPGHSIQWSVAEPSAATAIQNLFNSNGIKGISVIYTAPK